MQIPAKGADTPFAPEPQRHGMVGVKELSISSNKRVGVRGATVYFEY